MRDENVRWFNRSGLGKDPVAMHGAPISFTAEGTGLLPGKSLVLDQSALQNGYRMPYWLDEIRMQVFSGPVAADSELMPNYAASFQFRTGSLAFSKAPVAMSLHQPQYNNLSTQLTATYLDTTKRTGTTARWLLAKPLYMRPAETLQVSVFRDAVIAAGDGTLGFNVAVTYVGRALPPGSKSPLTRHVPWIASFTHDFANLYSETGVQAPFQNPFTRELYVHRWIGRPFSKAGSGLTNAFRTSMIPDDAGTKYAAMDVWDSTGYRIVKTGPAGGRFAPVGMVFDPERCTWTFARPLGAREQYNMAFQTQGTVGGDNQLFAVSMLAHREEDISMETYSPILLSCDQFTLNGDGNFATPPPQQFMNPSREAMLIDEFRFAYGQSDATLLLREHAQILADITFGNSQLTNQSIPLRSFCPTYYARNAERMSVWHLPKPLYVPPNVQVGIKLSRKNPFPVSWNSSPGTVFGISIAGRSVPRTEPVPRKIAVPWACATSCYDSTYDSTTGQTPDFTSKDNEICNPFDADLYMTYMAGFSIQVTTGLTPIAGPLLQATYGSGKMFVRDQTPLLLLFPENRPILRTRRLLKPKDFLKLQLSINPVVGATDENNQLEFTTIGLTGYRMMDTPQGAAPT